jgi:hypothetical protein
MFSQPSNTTWLKPRDHDGHLFLILRLIGIDKHHDDMKGGLVDRAEVELVDLSGTAAAERVWFTSAGLVNKVRNLDEPMLTRLEMIPMKKGNGWSFQPFEEGTDDTVAEQWLETHPKWKVYAEQAHEEAMKPKARVAVGQDEDTSPATYAKEPVAAGAGKAKGTRPQDETPPF